MAVFIASLPALVCFGLAVWAFAKKKHWIGALLVVLALLTGPFGLLFK
jgi:hypothetical protein